MLARRVQALLQLSDRFRHCGPSSRLLAGHEPIADRFLGEASLGRVLSQERRLGGNDLGELVFQRRRNAAVQLLATAAQQRAVGGVLYQRVLESVFSVGRTPAPEDQLGASELFEGFV